MKIETWNEIMDKMCDLMGYDKGIEACVDAKREIRPGTPIYELSQREDKYLLHKLRKRYNNYKNSPVSYGYEAE